MLSEALDQKAKRRGSVGTSQVKDLQQVTFGCLSEFGEWHFCFGFVVSELLIKSDWVRIRELS